MALRTFGIHTISILNGAFKQEVRFQHRSNIVLIGASAGMYGFLSSQIANIILNWIELTILQRIIYITLLVCATISDITVNIVMYDPQISYSAHVDGLNIKVIV